MKRLPYIVIAIMSLLLLPAFGEATKISRIKKVGKAPNFIALAPGGTKIYATSFGTDELLEVELSRQIITQRIGVGTGPLGFAIGGDGEFAIVACRDSETVAFVNLKNFRILADLKLSGNPNSVVIGPRGYNAYVSAYGRSREGFLHIIDIRQRSLAASIKVGIAPFSLVVSPTTEQVFVVMGGNNEVWVIDPERKAVVEKIPVGEAPDGIAITPDGKRIFVANSRTNDLSVIDTQLMKVLITVSIGKMPFGVAVSPDGKRVFVVNSGSRNVSVLPADLSKLEAETFSVDRGATDIKIGSDNRTVYVVNERSNTIVVADVP